jgi:hypothetical protein
MRTATVERPTTASTDVAPVTHAPSRDAAAPGIAVFLLEATTAATASMAAPARSANGTQPAEIGIASNRLPPVPTPVTPPPARHRIGARVADALDASRFGGRLILGAGVGLAIGIVVTILLLAIE